MCIDWVSKVHWDKTERCLSVWGQKKPSWDKTARFLSVWRQKKNPKNKVKHIYFRHQESESTTKFKNRSSDRTMTSDWLVDVSDDRCTTNHEWDSNSQLQWWLALIAQVVVNPTGIRSRPQQPLGQIASSTICKIYTEMRKRKRK